MNQLSVAALTALFNAGANPFYLSQAEGEELANLGYIAVDTQNTTARPDGQTGYLVSITEAGVSALTALQSQPTVPGVPGVPTVPAKPTFEVESGIEVPKTVRSGGNLTPRETIYPFEKLEIGQSFHVPISADNAEPWKKMASNVSAANARSQVDFIDPATGQVVMESKEVKTIVKNADGSKAKDANGKQVYSKSIVNAPKQIATKKFVARRVNESDPKGAGVRVFRVALD